MLGVKNKYTSCLKKTVCLFILCCFAILKSNGQCVVPMPNPGFEQPIISNKVNTIEDGPGHKGAQNDHWVGVEAVSDNRMIGWKTTSSNSWIGIWASGSFGIQAFEGNQFVELNHNDESGIYQDLSTPHPTVFTIKFSHRGGGAGTVGWSRTGNRSWIKKKIDNDGTNNGLDVCKLSVGPPDGPLRMMIKVSDGDAWGTYTVTYTVPVGQKVTRFLFEPVSSSGGKHSLGNFLDAVKITINNGINGSGQINLPCTASQAQVTAGGFGSWSQDPTNPSITMINLTPDDANNATTISGFTAPGIYRYTWKADYCISLLTVKVGGANSEKPTISSNSPVRAGSVLKLSSKVAVPMVLYHWTGPNGFTSQEPNPTVSTDASTAMGGVYTLTVSTDGCPSPSVSTTVVVKPNPKKNTPNSPNVSVKAISATAVSPTIVPPPISPLSQTNLPPPQTPHQNNTPKLLDQSERPLDGYYKKELVQTSGVIHYATIREADIIYSKRIWREIDLREKINRVFAAPKARLIDIILDAVYAGELTAYDPTGRVGDPDGDEFSRSLTPQQVMAKLTDSVLVPVLDKDGNTIGTRVKPGEFNPDSVTKFRIKEDWMFDKQRSVFEPRIVGIAPMIKIKAAGQSFDDQPAFWIYFPEVRPLLATKKIANRKNDATNLSYDDLFIKRIFSSYIVKESNVENLRIKDYMQGIDRLYESERIKKELMDCEHDLWSY
jgi:gliding motility associated protien GldN